MACAMRSTHATNDESEAETRSRGAGETFLNFLVSLSPRLRIKKPFYQQRTTDNGRLARNRGALPRAAWLAAGLPDPDGGRPCCRRGSMPRNLSQSVSQLGSANRTSQRQRLALP